MKCRKKPIVIEAFQMTKNRWKDDSDWPDWLYEAKCKKGISAGRLWDKKGELFCRTLEGVCKITFGDFIIQGIQGEIYPCKPEIFLATYDPI